MGKTLVLAIDPQNDFAHPQGNLFVPGADLDMNRFASFINNNIKKIDEIHVTLDSHHEVDIAHPIFWVNSKGEHPKIFTIISYKDVKDGVWSPTLTGMKDWCLYYTEELEKGKRYPLCIWPPHCRIGHAEKKPVLNNGTSVKVNGKELTYDFCGYATTESMSSALSNWAKTKIRTVNFVSKGSNPKVENYSVVKAEVPDPNDITTQVNTNFVQMIERGSTIFVGGEALSHCLCNSVQDLDQCFGNDQIKKFVLLIDCCSNVPGFESFGEKFINEFTAKGMRVMKSTEVKL